jgi:hypothetical protein
MKIVVGYDGSEAANRRARARGDPGRKRRRIIVVAAADSHAPAGIAEGTDLDRSEGERRRNDLEQAETILPERGVDADDHRGAGRPRGDVMAFGAHLLGCSDTM